MFDHLKDIKAQFATRQLLSLLRQPIKKQSLRNRRIHKLAARAKMKERIDMERTDPSIIPDKYLHRSARLRRQEERRRMS